MLKRLFRKRPIYSFRRRLLDEVAFRSALADHQRAIIDGCDPSRMCPYTMRALRARLDYHRHIMIKVSSYHTQMSK